MNHIARRLYAPLLLALACALPSAAAQQQSAAVPLSWVQVGSPDFPSLLAVPDHCLIRACALVVVSHPRGQTPERLRSSPQFTQLRDALVGGRFAVLLSSDGGPLSWGSPQGLKHVAEAHRQAGELFYWNGRTYALGLSMGGLMALRSALPGSPYAVSGVALIDGWVNLSAAWQSDPSRQGEIRQAYGDVTSLAAAQKHDPLPLALKSAPLAVLAVSSPDDKLVPASKNADLLVWHPPLPSSGQVKLTGPHLGGNRFGRPVGAALRQFFERLERQAGP
ncbi:MAG: alpha/beta hydrolase [Deinococcus sp.]|nr:alpha/beta hydrolase [Deinococcus sp.]